MTKTAGWGGEKHGRIASSHHPPLSKGGEALLVKAAAGVLRCSLVLPVFSQEAPQIFNSSKGRKPGVVGWDGCVCREERAKDCGIY